MTEIPAWKVSEQPVGTSEPLTPEKIAAACRLIVESGLLLGAPVSTAFKAAGILADALEKKS